MARKKGLAKRSVAAKTEKPKAMVRVSADTLPRRTLEQCLGIAEALHGIYAGKSATWDDLARALEISPTTASFKYLVWSAEAYGLVQRNENKECVLSEIGRKIVAPTYENEDVEGRVKAVLTPALLSKVYTDYNGHQLPSSAHFPNVLETKYGIPRDRVDEAVNTIISNGVFAKILESSPAGQMIVRLSGVGATPATTPEESAQERNSSKQEGATKATGADKATEDWSRVCFYITPIGDDGTEARKHADMMLKHLVEPATQDAGLEIRRADKIERSGNITQQILEYIVRSRLCIADLSFNNPNVFYELGVRHMTKLAAIQVVRKGDKIPFDVSQGRTIIVDTADVYTIMDRFESAKRELTEHIRNALSGDANQAAEGNPIAVYLPDLSIKLPS